jgi:hypothetical protein
MSDIDQLLTDAAKAILIAARPTALPSTVAIRAEHDTDPVERPYIAFAIEDAESRHPSLRVGSIELRLHVQVDDTDGPTAAAWHKAAADFFRENPASLAATLAPHGLDLKKLVPGTGLDQQEENRGRLYIMPFLFVVEKR